MSKSSSVNKSPGKSGNLQRFAVYRDRSPFAPAFLGEVLAADREAAERDGAKTYGGSVVAMRASGSASAPNPALERALAGAVRAAARQKRGRAFQRRRAQEASDA